MRTSEVGPGLASPQRDADQTNSDQASERDPWILDRDECLRLLGTTRVGRLILGARVPPYIIPVMYAVDGGRIVTEVPADAFAESHWPALITFEADHVDVATGRVWSVTVLGDCHVQPPVGSGAEPDERLIAIVAVDADLVTGRRFGATSPGGPRATSPSG